MSRGGRGGGGLGRMSGGAQLPFEVDTALEDQIAAYRAEHEDEDDWMKTLYPPMKVFHAPPPTAYEKKLVNLYREHRDAMRSGPFFVDVPKTNKRDPSEFNAFEDVSSYTNKRQKRARELPNLKKVPIVKELLPKELWDIVSDGEDDKDGEAPKKDFTFLKKKNLDKLARFDEGADLDAAGTDKDDDDDANEAEEDDEDGIAEPEDDDFSEDDDDLGNDYNAEKYFDDGDANDDEGDEGGGEDACDDLRKEAGISKVDAPFADCAQARVRSRTIGGLLADDPFDARLRAAAAADSLTRRRRELDGEVVVKPAGGSDFSCYHFDHTLRSKINGRDKRENPDLWNEHGHRIGFK